MKLHPEASIVNASVKIIIFAIVALVEILTLKIFAIQKISIRIYSESGDVWLYGKLSQICLFSKNVNLSPGIFLASAFV